MKKLLACALALSLLAAGCAPSAPVPAPPAAETPAPPQEELPPATEETPPLVYTDSAGREVPLPQPLLHIAPGNAEAQAFLFSLAPDFMAGWIAPPNPSFIGEGYRALPIFLGADRTPDWAAMQGAQTQAILYMGGALEAAELDDLQQQAGLPVLYIDSSQDNMANAFRNLGSLLGLEDHAEERAEYIAISSEDLLAKVSALPEDAHKKIYVATGTTGLLSGSLDILGLSGAVSVAEPGTELTLTTLQELAPDAIITSLPDVYAHIAGNADWQALDMVLMGLFYQSPEVPVNWLTDPSSPGQLMAAKWLYTLLYPDTGYDMLEETKLYVDTFYHYQLTDEQAISLLEKSIYKPIG